MQTTIRLDERGKGATMKQVDRSWRLYNGQMCKVQLQWEPRDWWMGLFWRTTPLCVHVYVCIVPLIPLHITWTTRRRSCENED